MAFRDLLRMECCGERKDETFEALAEALKLYYGVDLEAIALLLSRINKNIEGMNRQCMEMVLHSAVLRSNFEGLNKFLSTFEKLKEAHLVKMSSK